MTYTRLKLLLALAWLIALGIMLSPFWLMAAKAQTRPFCLEGTWAFMAHPVCYPLHPIGTWVRYNGEKVRIVAKSNHLRTAIRTERGDIIVTSANIGSFTFPEVWDGDAPAGIVSK